MFKDLSIFELIHAGGATIYILILCSVISVGVILERAIYYQRRGKATRIALMEAIRHEISRNQLLNAIGLCRKTDSPCAQVALAGLNLNGHDEKLIANAMEREITVETIKLERFTGILGTIGGTSVYVGLFGTVIGIMKAFNDIGTGGGGMDAVTHGISEALVCTAAGLLVAVPAVVGYNYFTRRIDNFVIDMELTASELVDILCVTKK